MIIVTGGAGFIGSSLVHYLNTLGEEEIVVVDRLGTDEKWKNLRGLNFDRYIHADDLMTHHILTKKPIRAVYHMGACSATTETDVDFLMRNNVDYTKELFRFCTKKDIPIVYASSAATYGGGEFGYDDNEAEVNRLKPLNPYGYSKQLVDEWVLRRERKPSRWFGVKFFNVYGPNEYHKGHMKSVVHSAFEQIKANGSVKLFKSHKEGYKDGEQLRDFVYVKDVVAAMVNLVAKDDREISGIYNLGTGKARTFTDLATATFSAMDKPANINFIDMPDRLVGQYQYYTQANMDKFKSVFPDFQFHTLEEGIKDYVQSHLVKEDPHMISKSSC